MPSTPSTKGLSPHRGRQTLGPPVAALSPVASRSRSSLPPLTPSRAKRPSREKTPQKAEIARKTPKKGENNDKSSSSSAEEGIQGKHRIMPKNDIEPEHARTCYPFHSHHNNPQTSPFQFFSRFASSSVEEGRRQWSLDCNGRQEDSQSSNGRREAHPEA